MYNFERVQEFKLLMVDVDTKQDPRTSDPYKMVGAAGCPPANPVAMQTMASCVAPGRMYARDTRWWVRLVAMDPPPYDT